jgi:hypothetical protein
VCEYFITSAKLIASSIPGREEDISLNIVVTSVLSLPTSGSSISNEGSTS